MHRGKLELQQNHGHQTRLPNRWILQPKIPANNRQLTRKSSKKWKRNSDYMQRQLYHNGHQQKTRIPYRNKITFPLVSPDSPSGRV